MRFCSGSSAASLAHAIEKYRAAARQDPKLADAHFSLGFALWKHRQMLLPRVAIERCSSQVLVLQAEGQQDIAGQSDQAAVA
jgi:hypothetical protein